MIRVGTSGFSYDDWHPRFYPEELPKRERLVYYAQRFGCVELNTTYYRQPSPGMMERMAAKVPAGFQFAVKVYGGITHDWRRATAGDFAAFEAGLAPLAESDRLGAVLAQFPGSFKPSRATVGHVRRLREAWPELPLVVEFRQRAWVDPRALELLRELSIGFCCVDEPELEGLMPAVAEATSRLGYVRFHGRNAARWHDHQEAWERYDYLYSQTELEEWLPRIKSVAAATDDLYVFFNNHYDAQAVVNARALAEQLELGAGSEDE